MAFTDRAHLDRTLNLEGKKRLVASLREDSSTLAEGALLELLREESWYLRDLAAGALVERGRRVAPALLDVIAGGLWYSRATAAVALGRIGAPEAALPLAAMLTEGNRTVAEAAVSGLTCLTREGGERAV